MFWGSTCGHALCVALYFTGLITDRQLIGITLSLSWAALQFEGWNGMRITDDQSEES